MFPSTVFLGFGVAKDLSDLPHALTINYMASVGKLFTATIFAILHEKGELSFDDIISKHLDAELMDNLHVYRDFQRHVLQVESVKVYALKSYKEVALIPGFLIMQYCSIWVSPDFIVLTKSNPKCS